jgi:hypothetical protein
LIVSSCYLAAIKHSDSGHPASCCLVANWAVRRSFKGT